MSGMDLMASLAQEGQRPELWVMSSCLAFWCSDLLEVFDDADLRLISDDLFASDDLFVSDDEDKSLVHVGFFECPKCCQWGVRSKA